MAIRYQDTAATLTSFSVDHAHIHRVVITGVPANFSISLCQVGITDGIYLPRILVTPEYLSDSGGFLRTSITLLNAAPYTVVGTGTTSYGSFADLYRDRKIQGATVSMRRVARGAGDADTSAIQYGNIVRISKRTGHSITLEIEPHNAIESNLAPANTIRRVIVAEPEKLSEEGIGKSYPMPFGRFYPYLPDSLYSGVTDTGYGEATLAGIPPAGSPMVKAEDIESQVRFLYGEKVGDAGFPAGGSEPGESRVQVYVPQVGAYAQVYDGEPRGENNLTLETDLWYGARAARMNRAPYMQLPLLASKYFGEFGGALAAKEPERAMDGKQDTYATLPYTASGGSIWQIPSVSRVGRISQNSSAQTVGPLDDDNFEGLGCPTGIQIFAYIAIPPGGPSIESAKVQMILVDPQQGALGHNFLGTGNGVLHTVALVKGIPQRIATDIPVSSTSGDLSELGWGLTKWEDWDFSTSSAIVADGDINYKLNPNRDDSPDNRNTVDQVGILLRNETASENNLAIISVGFLVSFRKEWDSTGEYDPNQIYTRSVTIERKGKRPITVIRGFQRKSKRVLAILPAGLPTKYGPEFGNPEESPYLSRTFYEGVGYRDTAGGTYTGSANADMVTPVEWAAWLLDDSEYGAQNIITSGLGSFTQARADLDQWTAWVSSGVTWDATSYLTEQDGVDAAIDQFEDMLPGPSQILKRQATLGYGAHIWIPKESVWTKWRSGTALHPRHIVSGSEGPAIQFARSGDGGIVNDLSIHYDYDAGKGEYRRTATCSFEGSDDGYGTEWPGTPTDGYTAEDLCSDSHNKYGRRTAEYKFGGIRDPRVAVAMGLAEVWRRADLIPQVEFVATPHVYDLESWHVFRFHNDLEDIFGILPAEFPATWDWADIWWRVTRAEQPQAGGGSESISIQAEWYPTTDQLGAWASIAGKEDFGKILGDLDFIPAEPAP